MAHQVNITLTGEEYNLFSAEAIEEDAKLERFLYEMLIQRLPMMLPSSDRPFSAHEVERYLYQTGLIEHIPTHEPDTPEEAAERKRLADLFGQIGPDGKTASEMVIEDRGPRE
jgi:hypothetical protein